MGLMCDVPEFDIVASELILDQSILRALESL